MSEVSQKIAAQWHNSSIYRVFDFHDEMGRGRISMAAVGVLSTIIGQLSGGFFYTGFLVGYGIDIVGIGILTFIPSICCLLGLLSPMLLERFKKRKLLLAVGRLSYYLVNIVGVTLLPIVIKDKTAQLWGFVAIVILANSINAIFSPGYSAWQANFLPESIRADYSIVSGCIGACVSGVVIFLVSLLTDSLAGSPKQLEMIILFRYIAFALAIIDVIVISLPKEYPYPRTEEKIKFSDTFTLPVRNKRFFLTVVILCVYRFATALPNATLNTYLLSEVGVSYSFMNGILSLFFVFYLVFGRFWSKLIHNNTWFRATGFFLIATGLSYVAYAFVNAVNYIWLLLIIRLFQHFLGVGGNTITGTLYLVNLPEENRTNYISFYTVCTSLSSFFGMMLGTGFTALLGEHRMNLFGQSWSSTPVLLLLNGVLDVLLAVFVFSVIRKVTPPDQLERMDVYMAARRKRRI